MKNKLNIYIASLLVGVLALTSCQEDYLDTLPTDQVPSVNAVVTTDNGMAVLEGIHRALYVRYGSQGRGGAGSFNMNIDELGEDHVFNSSTWTTSYRWILNSSPTNSYNTSHWGMFYKWIANANVLINAIDNAEGPQDERDNIKGQALVYRAYCHYQLVQTWAKAYQEGQDNTQLGVPIRLKNTPEPIERSTVEAVYKQIQDDLSAAIPLLEGKDRPNKSHINAAIAKGLKARVFLTQGKWGMAVTYAQQARADYPLMDQATYAAGFRDNLDANSEFMWASHIQEDQTNYFGNLGAYISRNYSSSSIRSNPRSINNLLYNMISDTDVRKSLFDPTGKHVGLELVSNAKKYPYTSQKFLAVSTSDSRMDVPMMRAAEMYLIEAEALARDTKYGLAAQVLYNLIVTRDQAYTLSTNTGQALIDEIMVHRRIELWGEGFRWFDLKRLNLPLDRTGSNHKSSITNKVMNVPVGDNRWVWAIPQDEIDANPLITDQNPI